MKLSAALSLVVTLSRGRSQIITPLSALSQHLEFAGSGRRKMPLKQKPWHQCYRFSHCLLAFSEKFAAGGNGRHY